MIGTCTTYRAIIEVFCSENKQIRGYQSRLAEAAGCQRSQFSQILQEKQELTLDQAARLAAFWHLNELETEFFLDLVQIERAASPQLRSFLRAKAKRVQRSLEDLSKKVKSDGQSDTIFEDYFSGWYWTAIHIATSIPELQNSADMAARFSLPQQLVEKCLQRMSDAGLVEHDRVGSRWLIRDVDFHFPKGTFCHRQHHSNWRLQSMLRWESDTSQAINYTSVNSMSYDDAIRIRELAAKLVTSTRKMIAESDPEEMYCFNLDFFQL